WVVVLGAGIMPAVVEGFAPVSEEAGVGACCGAAATDERRAGVPGLGRFRKIAVFLYSHEAEVSASWRQGSSWPACSLSACENARLAANEAAWRGSAGLVRARSGLRRLVLALVRGRGGGLVAAARGDVEAWTVEQAGGMRRRRDRVGHGGGGEGGEIGRASCGGRGE